VEATHNCQAAGMGEPLCSFLGHVVVDQVVTAKAGGRAVAAKDKGVRGEPLPRPRRTKPKLL